MMNQPTDKDYFWVYTVYKDRPEFKCKYVVRKLTQLDDGRTMLDPKFLMIGNDLEVIQRVLAVDMGLILFDRSPDDPEEIVCTFI